MAQLKEINVLEDFTNLLDNFYSIVKTQIGTLISHQYIQLQATAIPVSISAENPWFSFGILNDLFDVRMNPEPVSNSLELLYKSRFSTEYISMLSTAIRLVETKELDSDTISKINELETKIANSRETLKQLYKTIQEDWESYSAATLTSPGDKTTFEHWVDGHPYSRRAYNTSQENLLDEAFLSSLRLRQYDRADDQLIVQAYEKVTSPAARIRYPRYPDSYYLEESKKFSPIYFASLPDNESSLFRNLQLITPDIELSKIGRDFGRFSSVVTKESIANSRIQTDWKVATGGEWTKYFYSVKLNVEAQNSQVISDDFKTVSSVTVGADSVMAIPMIEDWYLPDILNNSRIVENQELFSRFIGPKGSILYKPAMMIVARGFKISFKKSEEWKYDYENQFKSSTTGSGSFKVMGINFGKATHSGGYNKDIKEQKIERRGNELEMYDGDNVRLLGYVVTKVKPDELNEGPDFLAGRFRL
jgi:hypothetical protein